MRSWHKVFAVFAVGFALACASDSGPPEEDVTSSTTPPAASDERARDRGVEGTTVAGRSTEGVERAERIGLETVYFDYDRSELRYDAKAALRRNADILRKNPRVRVEVQGNCDERGSEEYNLALGERRARSARDYLVGLGVGPERFAVVSFGESNPAVRGYGETAWAKNRRADFVVLP